MKTITSGCPYCASDARKIARLKNFKHIWSMCAQCKNITRKDRDNFPTDGIVSLLSRSNIGRKISNRLVPYFMRRGKLEAAAYASYGEYFKWILDPQAKAEGFVAVKRLAYHKEPDGIRSLFARHDISLRDKSILDVSGGPGTFAHFMKNEVGSISVSEYDPTTVAAMQELLPGVRVFQADLNDRWTDRESFDVALYRSCIVFCRDLPGHLDQFIERLNDGGYVYIYTARPTLGNTLRWQYEDYTMSVMYDQSYVHKLVTDRGFQVIDQGVTEEYRHYLRWFTVKEALPLLWGIWNLFLPNRPRGLDAKAFWLLAKKVA